MNEEAFLKSIATFDQKFCKALLNESSLSQFCSPLSLYILLGITSLLSGENTKTQILNLLGINESEFNEPGYAEFLFHLLVKIETTNMDSIPSELQNLYSYSNRNEYSAIDLPEISSVMISDIEKFLNENDLHIDETNIFTSLQNTYDLASSIEKILKPTTKTSKTSIKLFSSEDIWPNSKLRLSPSLFEAITKVIIREVESVNYSSSEINIINNRIKKLTNISDFLSSQFISPQTAFLCTSALSFSGSWRIRFIHKDSMTMPFTNFHQQVSPVLMMKVCARFDFLETEQFRAVSIPYDDPTICLVIILPNENTKDELNKSLDIFLQKSPSFSKNVQNLSPCPPNHTTTKSTKPNNKKSNQAFNSLEKQKTIENQQKISISSRQSISVPSERAVQSAMAQRHNNFSPEHTSKTRIESKLGIETKLRFIKCNISLQIPQFDITSPTLSLKNILESMGLTDLFSPENACFVGRSYVSDILQKTHFESAENGMKIKPHDSIIEDEPIIKFCANRPFWYLVMDSDSWNIIFLGNFTM